MPPFRRGGRGAAHGPGVADLPYQVVFDSDTAPQLAPSDTFQVRARAISRTGLDVATTFTYKSSAPTKVSVDKATGELTGGASAGDAVIRATAANGVYGEFTATLATPTPTVDDIVVNPATQEIEVGETASITATAVDAALNPITGRTFTADTDDHGVATFDDEDVAEPVHTEHFLGVAPGTVTVTIEDPDAMKSKTAEIVVVSAPPPSTAWLENNFGQYSGLGTAVGNKLTGVAGEVGADRYSAGNPTGFWGPDSEDAHADYMSLMTDGDGLNGRSSKYLRYSFPTGAVCGDTSITLHPVFPQTVQEVWAEIHARFSTNFTPVDASCSKNNDYKFIFVRVHGPNPTGRFEVKVCNSGGLVTCGLIPNNPIHNASPAVPRSAVCDGQWHVWRVHAKLGAAGAAEFDAWFDGTRFLNIRGESTTSTDIYGLKLGANLNKKAASAAPMTVDWGLVRIYKTNPGW